MCSVYSTITSTCKKFNLKIITVLMYSVFIIAPSALSQNMNYAKQIIKDLSSDTFFGRAYSNKGDSIAAEYLKNEIKNIGLKKVNDSYYQKYTISVNTISSTPIVRFCNNKLKPAEDFIIIPSSPDVNAYIPICKIDKNIMTNYWAFNHFFREDKSHCLIMIDSTGMDNPELFSFANLMLTKDIVDSKGIIEITSRLKYTARTELSDKIHIQVNPKAVNYKADSVFISIENEFFESYETQNIIGYIKGKTDTIIMITAHYDHLGMMGNIMFPGANDNASGVSMLLNLAKYYSKKNTAPKHTLVFALFSGEEAGLLGSRYFVNNPLFDLDLIKLLINFDMVGTGKDGVVAFNAKEYSEIDSILTNLYNQNKYFNNFRTTEAVYSSDHAPFHEKSVNALFFMTAGGNENYHQPNDKFEYLSFDAYQGLFKMITDLINEISD